MKSLTKHIAESLNSIGIYESFNNIGMYESLRLSIDDDPYQYHPKTWDELRQIILDRYNELGPGTAEVPIDFNDIDVSKITTFYDKHTGNGIFEGTDFKYIDVSEWNISKINSLRFAFAYCSCLKELDISNWDISNIKESQYMFYRCHELERLLLPDFTKIKNINMIDMFNRCNPKSIPNWYIV